MATKAIEKSSSARVRLYYLILAVVFFATQELLFRLVFPVPEISNFNRVNYSMLFQDTPPGSVQYLSNAAFSWASDPDEAEFVHHLNLYGFRDVTWPVEGNGRVMFIGDSFVEGFMTSDDKTIPRGFAAAAMAAGRPLETMNMGIGASGIVDYLAVIRDAVPIFLPETVVLVMYANDFADNGAASDSLDEVTAQIRSNPYIPRLYVVVSTLARGGSVATRWLKPPFLFLPTAESESSPLHDEEFVAHIRSFVSPEILEAMQRGRFNPFMVNQHTIYSAYLPRPKDMSSVIERTKNFVEAHGSRLLVVHIPYKGQVSDHYLAALRQFDENKQLASLMPAQYQLHADMLRADCERHDVPFLDLTDFLREREARGERVYWEYDEHMKAETYLLLGRRIYQFWDMTDTSM